MATSRLKQTRLSAFAAISSAAALDTAFHLESSTGAFVAAQPVKFSFPAGVSAYESEPYTLQNTLEYGGKFYVCGTGRQPLLRDKTANDSYWLLTLAAIAKEIKQRCENHKNSVVLAAALVAIRLHIKC